MRKTLLCLAVITALCGAAFAQDGGWPLAVRIMSYGKFQDAAWQHLSKIGVHYIFLPVPEPGEVDALMKKLADNKLTALVLRGNTDLSKAGCVDELAGQAAVCEKMGVKYMFLSAKLNGAEKSAVLERLRKAGDAAQKHGVTITLETHPELGTNGDVQVETMKALNHPNVRVNFDTGNISFYNKGTDAVTELKKSIGYVGTVEFKDHSCEFETWNFPALGTGKVDFPGLIKTLQENHYAGPVTIEFEGVKGVELSETETKKAIEDSVKYLHSLAPFK